MRNYKQLSGAAGITDRQAVDPDLKAEFEARQREGPMAAMSGQQQNPLGNFDMAAFLAGSGKKEGGAGAGSVSDGRNEPVRR